MQTFLPYRSFIESAKVLDNKRLGCQRKEVLQILKALTDPAYGWQNHPAVKMWRGYTNELVLYGIAICDEWIRRGYRDTCREKIAAFMDKSAWIIAQKWRGDEAFHASHRSNLLRKNPEHYRQFWPDEPSNLPYVWPTSNIVTTKESEE